MNPSIILFTNLLILQRGPAQHSPAGGLLDITNQSGERGADARTGLQLGLAGALNGTPREGEPTNLPAATTDSPRGDRPPVKKTMRGGAKVAPLR